MFGKDQGTDWADGGDLDCQSSYVHIDVVDPGHAISDNNLAVLWLWYGEIVMYLQHFGASRACSNGSPHPAHASIRSCVYIASGRVSVSRYPRACYGHCTANAAGACISYRIHNVDDSSFRRALTRFRHIAPFTIPPVTGE